MSRRLVLIVLLVLVPRCVAFATAPTGVVQEYEVKAAFLYNVLKFVEWPSAAMPAGDGPLQVAVLTPAPLPEISATLGGRTIKGHALEVRTYARASDVRACHVLFVTTDAAAEMRDALDLVQGQPVLTVIEQPGTVAKAVITVAVVDTRLAFHVDLDAADLNGLQLSSNLLGLAKSVRSTRLKRGRP